jgi:prepilin-type processing-associated H-X9-DG protein
MGPWEGMESWATVRIQSGRMEELNGGTRDFPGRGNLAYADGGVIYMHWLKQEVRGGGDQSF